MNDTPKGFTFSVRVVDRLLKMRSLSANNHFTVLYQESDRLWLKYVFQTYCPKCQVRRCVCINGTLNLDCRITRYYLMCDGSYPENKN